MNKLTEILKITTRGTNVATTVEKAMDIKEVILKREYSIKDIMNALNTRTLMVYEEIYVTGFLSRSGCLGIPETYYDEKRQFDSVNIRYGKNGKKTKEMTMNVKQNLLPSFYPEQSENQCIAFLYLNKDDRFKVQKNSEAKMYITDSQRYIPVIMSKKDYYQYVDNYIEMKCCCVPLEEDIIDESDNLLNEITLYSLFYDMYQPYVTCFALDMIECHIIPNSEDINENDYVEQFCVEYEFNRNISNRMLTEYVNEFLNYKELNGLPKSFQVGNVTLLLTNTSLSINVSKKKVGFYLDMNLNDPTEYKSRIIFLKKTITNFFKKAREPHELSFITDERRVRLFDL